MGERATFSQKSRRTALLLIAVCAALLLFFSLIQRRLIYYPTRLPEGAARRWGISLQTEPWQNSAGAIIGWKRLTKSPSSSGQVLLLHGNAGSALDRAHYADALENLEPFDLYILEYPGYGCRSGSPSQSAILAAAREAVELLPAKIPLYVAGESLGTGAASYLAGLYPQRVAGLMLIAPYNNLAAVAQQHFPLLPAKWLLRDKYPSDQYLQSYAGPIAFLLAGKDAVVAPAFSRKLFHEYRGRKRIWDFPNATHDSVTAIQPDVWKQVIAFWRGEGK